jgi:CheY-like chemotaxis protein
MDTAHNRSAKILLVEDEFVPRMVHLKMIKDLGYVADLAVTGQEALKLSVKNYDLILMDIGLPDISGVEVTQRIRTREKNGKHRTSIVAITAYATSDICIQCMEAGMDHVFYKPVILEQLQCIIDDYAALEKL